MTAPEGDPQGALGIGAEMAAARLGAAFGPCRHERPEPVDLLATGERVAMVCADCLERLPADWSGDVDVIKTGDGRIVAYIPR